MCLSSMVAQVGQVHSSPLWSVEQDAWTVVGQYMQHSRSPPSLQTRQVSFHEEAEEAELGFFIDFSLRRANKATSEARSTTQLRVKRAPYAWK